MSEIKRFRAKIFGIVQGVGFRWFVQREAKNMELVGYVRNINDGTVEVDAQGIVETIEKFIVVIRKGPRMGTVSGMEMEWLPPLDNNTEFEIRF